jgi:hypothetical protein
MNSIIDQDLPGIHRLRDQLFDMIADPDLAYKLPGHNPTLGELCVEAGLYQQIYTRSFKSFSMDWGYRGSTPESTDSVAKNPGLVPGAGRRTGRGVERAFG